MPVSRSARCEPIFCVPFGVCCFRQKWRVLLLMGRQMWRVLLLMWRQKWRVLLLMWWRVVCSIVAIEHTELVVSFEMLNLIRAEWCATVVVGAKFSSSYLAHINDFVSLRLNEVDELFGMFAELCVGSSFSPLSLRMANVFVFYFLMSHCYDSSMQYFLNAPARYMHSRCMRAVHISDNFGRTLRICALA